MKLLKYVVWGVGLSSVLVGCGQKTVADACLNQWNLCIEGTDMVQMYDQDAFMDDCAAAADGLNESGTVASQSEVDCVADAASCSEIDACVE